MQESCVEGGEPACPEEGEWVCTPPQYLCGATCQASSPSTCSGKTFVTVFTQHDIVNFKKYSITDILFTLSTKFYVVPRRIMNLYRLSGYKNTTVKAAAMYTAITAASFNMEFGYSDTSVPLAPLKPYSFFSIGCPTGASTVDIPAEVMFKCLIFHSTRINKLRLLVKKGNIQTRETRSESARGLLVGLAALERWQHTANLYWELEWWCRWDIRLWNPRFCLWIPRTFLTSHRIIDCPILRVGLPVAKSVDDGSLHFFKLLRRMTIY